LTTSRIGAPLNDPAAELDFLVGVIQRDDGQPDPRIARRVLGLECALACADEDRVALEVDPHRSNLRRPIAHQCRKVGEVGATDERLDLLRELVHMVSLASLSHLASFAVVLHLDIMTSDG